jgi:gamma-glutamylputrescine oxidase
MGGLNFSKASFWERNSFLYKKDVIIIGAGLTGLWSAYHLKKSNPKLRIAVLERGAFSSGASTKNAGFACFGSAGELLDDLNKVPRNELSALIADRHHGLQNMVRTLGADKIHYEPKGGFELFASSEEAKPILEKMDTLNELMHEAIGERPYRLALDKISSSGFAGIHSCIENTLEGQLDTGKMYQQLLALVRSMDVACYCGIQVLDIKNGGNPQVETSYGTIEANRILLCTNGFAKSFFPDLSLEPARAQVLITKPLEKQTIQGSFHMHQGYYYFRDVGKRVLIGGARHLNISGETTTEEGITEQITDDLTQLLRKHILPHQNFEIDYAWSGVMGVGAVKKPILEMVRPNVYVAVRLGGMGVALSYQLGKHASDLLLA